MSQSNGFVIVGFRGGRHYWWRAISPMNSKSGWSESFYDAVVVSEEEAKSLREEFRRTDPAHRFFVVPHHMTLAELRATAGKDGHLGFPSPTKLWWYQSGMVDRMRVSDTNLALGGSGLEIQSANEVGWKGLTRRDEYYCLPLPADSDGSEADLLHRTLWCRPLTACDNLRPCHIHGQKLQGPLDDPHARFGVMLTALTAESVDDIAKAVAEEPEPLDLIRRDRMAYFGFPLGTPERDSMLTDLKPDGFRINSNDSELLRSDADGTLHLSAAGREFIRVTPTGEVFVRGEPAPVASSVDVYETFRAWVDLALGLTREAKAQEQAPPLSVVGTVSGRLSASKPNTSSLPRGDLQPLVFENGFDGKSTTMDVVVDGAIPDPSGTRLYEILSRSKGLVVLEAGHGGSDLRDRAVEVLRSHNQTTAVVYADGVAVDELTSVLRMHRQKCNPTVVVVNKGPSGGIAGHNALAHMADVWLEFDQGRGLVRVIKHKGMEQTTIRVGGRLA